MGFTNFQNGLTSFGIPQLGFGIPPNIGKCLVVGTNSSFIAPDSSTIQGAINALGDVGGTALVMPGSYNEALTLVRSATSTGPIAIVGLGNPGDIGVSPSAANAVALTNDRDDVTLINLDFNSNGTGTAFVNTGSRLRAYGCKFENDDGTGLCALMTLQTVAQRAAHTKGNGADCWLIGCEFAWAASGLELSGTDEGAVTELRVQNCIFHDLDTKHILEVVGSGGAAGVMFNSLLIDDCTFMRDEAGTQPTDYILLNGANTNTGVVSRCVFATALNGGKNLVSTALLWVGNFHTAGISTGQPS